MTYNMDVGTTYATDVRQGSVSPCPLLYCPIGGFSAADKMRLKGEVIERKTASLVRHMTLTHG